MIQTEERKGEKARKEKKPQPAPPLIQTSGAKEIAANFQCPFLHA